MAQQEPVLYTVTLKVPNYTVDVVARNDDEALGIAVDSYNRRTGFTPKKEAGFISTPVTRKNSKVRKAGA